MWHFTENHKCQPHGGARGKVREWPKSLGFILWAPYISVPHFITIHPIFVQIFQSGPNCWTDRQTDIAVHRATPHLKWYHTSFIALKLDCIYCNFCVSRLQLPSSMKEHYNDPPFKPKGSVWYSNHRFTTVWWVQSTSCQRIYFLSERFWAVSF